MGKIKKKIKEKIPGLARAIDGWRDQKNIEKGIATSKIWNKNEMASRDEVIFLAQYIPAWNCYEDLFLDLIKGKSVKPRILLLPLQKENGEWEYSSEQNTFFLEISARFGPESIEKVYSAGKLIDPITLNPKLFIYTRPYNAFLPDSYRSSYLKNIAPLGYSSYGLLLTKNLAWTVLNSDFFKDLSYFFPDSRSAKEIVLKKYKKLIQNKQLEVYELEKAGLKKLKKKTLVENPVHKQKMTVLWTPRWNSDPSFGGSNFLEYIDAFLNFAENYQSDLNFIFRPHPLTWQHFMDTGELSPNRADNLKRRISESSNIVLDDKGDYQDSFNQADILVTDLSSIIPEFFFTGKPVIFCENNMKLELLDEIEEMFSCCYRAKSFEDVRESILNYANGKDPLRSTRMHYLKNDAEENNRLQNPKDSESDAAIQDFNTFIVEHLDDKKVT